jgi:hypothetical protein
MLLCDLPSYREHTFVTDLSIHIDINAEDLAS